MPQIGTNGVLGTMMETERLLLKQISNDDSTFIRYYLSDSDRTRYLPLGSPYSSSEADDWLKSRIAHWKTYHFGTFLVQEKNNHADIGYCGLEYVPGSEFIDIRYGLIQRSWGKGYAFEAALECVRIGFKYLHCEIIYGAAMRENVASIHILKKMGMKGDRNFTIYGSAVESFSLEKIRYDSLWNTSK